MIVKIVEVNKNKDYSLICVDESNGDKYEVKFGCISKCECVWDCMFNIVEVGKLFELSSLYCFEENIKKI